MYTVVDLRVCRLKVRIRRVILREILENVLNDIRLDRLFIVIQNPLVGFGIKFCIFVEDGRGQAKSALAETGVIRVVKGNIVAVFIDFIMGRLQCRNRRY